MLGYKFLKPYHRLNQKFWDRFLFKFQKELQVCYCNFIIESCIVSEYSLAVCRFGLSLGRVKYKFCLLNLHYSLGLLNFKLHVVLTSLVSYELSAIRAVKIEKYSLLVSATQSCQARQLLLQSRWQFSLLQ